MISTILLSQYISITLTIALPAHLDNRKTGLMADFRPLPARIYGTTGGWNQLNDIFERSQKKAAEAAISGMSASGTFRDPIVTEITQAGAFYSAEAYHQDYYRANKDRPYCRFIIAPKLNKLGLED